MRIRAVNARFGGASHDSFIWNGSAERDLMENVFKNDNRNPWLLGKKKLYYILMYFLILHNFFFLHR